MVFYSLCPNNENHRKHCGQKTQILRGLRRVIQLQTCKVHIWKHARLQAAHICVSYEDVALRIWKSMGRNSDYAAFLCWYLWSASLLPWNCWSPQHKLLCQFSLPCLISVKITYGLINWTSVHLTMQWVCDNGPIHIPGMISKSEWS